MKKKQKRNIQALKATIRPSTIIICLLVISQLVSAYYIFKNREYINHDSQQSLTSFVNSTEEKRYSHPVIDVSENRVYIPEARIYFPLNDTTRHLRYEYSNAFSQPKLHISMRGVVGSQKQGEPATCDKMLSFSREASDSINLVSEIEPTKDGFNYIYRHPKCDIYYGTIYDDLSEAAKEVRTY